jgi:hypothetical protein
MRCPQAATEKVADLAGHSTTVLCGWLVIAGALSGDRRGSR